MTRPRSRYLTDAARCVDCGRHVYAEYQGRGWWLYLCGCTDDGEPCRASSGSDPVAEWHTLLLDQIDELVNDRPGVVS